MGDNTPIIDKKDHVFSHYFLAYYKYIIILSNL